MVAGLFILTVIIFLIIDYYSMRKKEREKAALVKSSFQSTKPSAMKSKLFYHPSHTWVKIIDNYALIGVNDFARRVIGKVQRLDVPPTGTHIEQGQTVWKLWHNTKILPQSSPVTGEVVEINSNLIKNPDIINESPYEAGWILKIKSSTLRQNLNNLLHGETALRWLDIAREQLIRRFSYDLGPVCTDGGEIIEGVSELFTDDEWEDIIKYFFKTDPLFTDLSYLNQ